MTQAGAVLLGTIACGCIDNPSTDPTTQSSENQTDSANHTTTVSLRSGALQVYNFRESSIRGELTVERQGRNIVKENVVVEPKEVKDFGVVFNEYSDYTVEFVISEKEKKAENITYRENSWENLKIYILDDSVKFSKATS